MKVKSENGRDALRQEAERRLEEKHAGRPKVVEADLRRLQHELEVHQIELEMTNEELLAARVAIEAELERYSDHFDFAPVGYFNLSADGTIKLVNLAGTKLVNIERAQLLGRRFMLLVVESHRRKFTDFLAQVFENRGRIRCELALAYEGDAQMIVRLDAALSPDGTECRMAILNISEIKRAEEAALKVARFTQSTLDALTAHLCVLDQQGNIRATNKAWNRFAEANPPVNLTVKCGANYLEVCETATGMAAEDAQAFAQGIRDVIGGARENYSLEYPCHSPNEERWFVGHVTRFMNDEESCAVVFHENITERKVAENSLRASEADFRSLFENMLNGIAYCRMIFVDDIPHDYVYVAVNLTFESMTGLKNVVGKKVSEVLPRVRDQDAGLFEIFGRVVKTGVPEKFEKYIVSIGMWLSISAYRPAPGHFAAVFDVITERKQAEQNLRRSEEQLRALATRLLSIREIERAQIAREIHDVLAQELTLLKFDIVWVNRRIASALDESTRAALVEKLDGLTDRTNFVIGSVQKIATDLRPVVLDSHGLNAAIEWQTADFTKRTGIVCDTRVPAIPLSIGRDQATAVFRILQESLTNILRHAQATRAIVELAVSDGELTLNIQDNGCGISANKLSDTRSIGLVGMRERALAFNGKVEIGEAAGTGTIVKLRMPLVPNAEHELS